MDGFAVQTAACFACLIKVSYIILLQPCAFGLRACQRGGHFCFRHVMSWLAVMAVALVVQHVLGHVQGSLPAGCMWGCVIAAC